MGAGGGWRPAGGAETQGGDEAVHRGPAGRWGGLAEQPDGASAAAFQDSAGPERTAGQTEPVVSHREKSPQVSSMSFRSAGASAAQSELSGGPAGVTAAGAGCTDRGTDGSPLRTFPRPQLESNSLIHCAGTAEPTGSWQVAPVLLIARVLAASPAAQL